VGATTGLLVALAAASACTSNGFDAGEQQNVSSSPDTSPLLAKRVLDYGQALRNASVKLLGRLPTLAEVHQVADSPDPKGAYEALIDAYLANRAFSVQIRSYFRDSFKLAEGALDTAPTFAAQLVVENRSYMELFTATTNTCPTLNEATGTFAPASCNSGAPVTAGVLTDPNAMKQFASNLAFRRVRWVQETFACTAYPAEVTRSVDVGGASSYTGPWEFQSVAGPDTGGRIDFRDTKSVVCANCHGTMNHRAPLFALFGDDGRWKGDFAVAIPATGNPTVKLSDYLPPGEPLAWKHGQPVSDLAGFGQAMAADPQVAQCAVTRVWNWALGHGDVVDQLATVPAETLKSYVDDFQRGDYRLRELLRAVFTSDDFVKF
jgi:hypothetical protein